MKKQGSTSAHSITHTTTRRSRVPLYSSSLDNLKEEIAKLSQMKNLGVNYGDRWGKYLITVGDLQNLEMNYGINTRTQRKYLFKDVLNGSGSTWQRNLFASFLLNNPLPQLEISANLDADGNIKFLIQDGQQRYRTLGAILGNCVKTPKYIEELNDKYIGWGNKSYSALPIELQNEILNFPLELLVSFGLSEEEEYQRFIVINNGTPLSKQDRRSAQVSVGAEYIQSIVDGEPTIHYGLTTPMVPSPKFKVFNITVSPQTIEHTFIKVSPFGRSAEEVVAHWFNSMHNSSIQTISQDSLDRLYSKFELNGTIPSETTKSRFEKYLKTLSDSIVSFDNRKKIEGRVFLFSFYVLRHFLDAKIKVDTKTFISDYLTAIAILKKENKAWNPRGPVNDPTVDQKYTRLFTELFRTGSFDYQIERVVSQIVETMTSNMKKSGRLVVLSNRKFSDDDKRIRLEEQNGCCGYCGKEISVEEGIGDHMIPHSDGGRTEIDNLVVSCDKCNELKGSLPYESWMILVKSGMFKNLSSPNVTETV